MEHSSFEWLQNRKIESSKDFESWGFEGFQHVTSDLKLSIRNTEFDPWKASKIFSDSLQY